LIDAIGMMLHRRVPAVMDYPTSDAKQLQHCRRDLAPHMIDGFVDSPDPRTASSADCRDCAGSRRRDLRVESDRQPRSFADRRADQHAVREDCRWSAVLADVRPRAARTTSVWRTYPVNDGLLRRSKSPRRSARQANRWFRAEIALFFAPAIKSQIPL